MSDDQDPGDLRDGRSAREKQIRDELVAERAKFAELVQRLLMAHSALHVEQAAHEQTKGEFERFKRDVARGKR